MPKFSVIIPTFNRKECLKAALESVTRQTHTSFEVIISDDGSTDGTELIIDYFQGRFPLVYLRQENWGGPARPRNLAIAAATGEWLAFLDSDDLWRPDKLEVVDNNLAGCDVIYHAMDVLDANGNFRYRIDAPQIDLKDPFRDLILQGNRLATSATCVRRSAFQAVGAFREDKSVYVGEDFDLWLRLAKSGYKFRGINTSLGDYTIGNNNISQLSPRYTQSIRKVILDNCSSLSKAEISMALQFTDYVFGMTEYRNGNYRASLRYFIRCMINTPTTTSLKALVRILIPKRIIEKFQSTGYFFKDMGLK
jgi:glycosyltransferase involved in cell wall biosynthesis